jgi:hypothetical protein
LSSAQRVPKSSDEPNSVEKDIENEEEDSESMCTTATDPFDPEIDLDQDKRQELR